MVFPSGHSLLYNCALGKRRVGRMLYKLAFPLLFILAPRFLPHIIRMVRLVWRLIRDKRVSIVLRALVPLAILYVISPIDLIKDRIPIIGRFDDLVVLGLALLFLIKFAPQHVIDEHMGKSLPTDRPEDSDPSKVVDGSSKLIDE